MNNLRKLRNEQKITMDELSAKTNISKSVISYLENEKRPFTQEHLEILSKFFKVSIDYLLGKTDNKKMQSFVVADADGTITTIQHELIDATKGLTTEDMKEIFNYIDFVKSKKKEDNKNEK